MYISFEEKKIKTKYNLKNGRNEKKSSLWLPSISVVLRHVYLGISSSSAKLHP